LPPPNGVVILGQGHARNSRLAIIDAATAAEVQLAQASDATLATLDTKLPSRYRSVRVESLLR